MDYKIITLRRDLWRLLSPHGWKTLPDDLRTSHLLVAIPPYFFLSPCLSVTLSLRHSVTLSLCFPVSLYLSLSLPLSSSPFYLSPSHHYPKTELLALNKLLCCLLLNKTLVSCCCPLHLAVEQSITTPAQVVRTVTLIGVVGQVF